MTSKGYSSTQIALHWVVVILFAAQFLFSDSMSEAWDAYEEGGTTVAGSGIWVHIIPGVLILIAALWRLALRLSHGVPAAPEGPAWQRLAGEVVHWALYAVMIALPLSGMAAWFGGIEDAGDVHQLFKMAAIALVVLHVVAALYHQYVVKDGLIRRMMRAED
ncbi:cytochrome b [Fuscibacter oryzae]|uniref:Cytochrome b n=1 Tax=Fuscibacter oryzae TaxID=2803939 RepID=A0A8J7MQF6_9RHOB|nr:cytochrome b/b6 domain-containing protein [Fuscibacter oryzae]MBL4928572.1 cytochrome b [Fuscibacter oryzae]